MLHRLYEHQTDREKFPFPQKHPDKDKECPQFGEVIKYLLDDELLKLVNRDELFLTEEGISKVKNDLLLDNKVEKSMHPRIFLRPVGTGPDLIEDDTFFEKLRERERYTCGYDMEGYSVIESAWFHDIEKAIFVKSVSDYGDSQRGRNGHFRSYACQTSAAFLIDFLKENLFK